MIRNAMSVDIEDWFQVGAFETVVNRSDWETIASRVEANSEAVLNLFDQAGVKATFFTLGWVAERHPILMRRIVDAGHEIASHGYGHERVFTLTPDQFRANVERTKKLLEDATGAPVTGYRAPSFSIDARTPWAHRILVETGHHYSSSVAPVAHDHYGWANSPRFAWHPVEGTDFLELPVTTATWAGRRLAAGGGGFFRLLPYGFSRWAIRQVNNRDGQSAIFYFHPWEIDPDQPRLAHAPVKSRLRHYSRLATMAGKMRRLLGEFSWAPLNQLPAVRNAAGGAA